ncbi:MAG TPA: hypothetical protein ENF81_04970 [Thermotogaceae bacterium]|nr:hypothetical protein [Thermotogaceae bacterium]
MEKLEKFFDYQFGVLLRFEKSGRIRVATTNGFVLLAKTIQSEFPEWLIGKTFGTGHGLLTEDLSKIPFTITEAESKETALMLENGHTYTLHQTYLRLGWYFTKPVLGSFRLPDGFWDDDFIQTAIYDVEDEEEKLIVFDLQRSEIAFLKLVEVEVKENGAEVSEYSIVKRFAMEGNRTRKRAIFYYASNFLKISQAIKPQTISFVDLQGEDTFAAKLEEGEYTGLISPLMGMEKQWLNNTETDRFCFVLS